MTLLALCKLSVDWDKYLRLLNGISSNLKEDNKQVSAYGWWLETDQLNTEELMIVCSVHF